MKSPLPFQPWHGLPEVGKCLVPLQDTRESRSVEFRDESSTHNSKIPSQPFLFSQKRGWARPEFIGQRFWAAPDFPGIHRL